MQDLSNLKEEVERWETLQKWSADALELLELAEADEDEADEVVIADHGLFYRHRATERVAHEHVRSVDDGTSDRADVCGHGCDGLERRTVGARPAREVERDAVPAWQRLDQAVVDPVIAGRAM